jgi:hypothetical protein
MGERGQSDVVLRPKQCGDITTFEFRNLNPLSDAIFCIQIKYEREKSISDESIYKISSNGWGKPGGDCLVQPISCC